MGKFGKLGHCVALSGLIWLLIKKLRFSPRQKENRLPDREHVLSLNSLKATGVTHLLVD